MSVASPPRINYETPAARVQMERIQVVEPDRVRPAPVQQRPVQVVSGTHAWNMAAPPAPRPAPRRHAQPQPAAVEERTMEIWTTPHGFLKAAAANNATSQPAERRIGSVVHRGREIPIRRPDQRAEPGRARSDVDRQHGARRHAGRNHLLRLSRLQRRDVPGQNRPDAGRASGAGYHRLVGHRESRRRPRRFRTRCAASRLRR